MQNSESMMHYEANSELFDSARLIQTPWADFKDMSY